MTSFEAKKSATEAFSLLLKGWTGELIHCEKKNGKKFTAKLIAVHGNQLLFEDRTGRRLIDSLSSLEHAAPLSLAAKSEEGDLN